MFQLSRIIELYLVFFFFLFEIIIHYIKNILKLFTLLSICFKFVLEI